MLEQLPNHQYARRHFLKQAALIGGGVCCPELLLAKKKAHQLQILVHQKIKALRFKSIIKPYETTAWSIYDFYTQKKLVSINENRFMQAASMMKVFVALAYFYLNRVNAKKHPYSVKERNLMQRMLVKSSNSATNALMRLCGGPSSVERLCQKATNNRFRKLSLVEYIPSGGRTYKNKISARDYSRFLYAMWHNQLPSSLEIKRIMSMSNRDRIRGNTIPSSAKIYDKTGSTGYLCGDMGIVQVSGKKAYTFIGIIQTNQKAKNYGAWISQKSNAIRSVSAVSYRFLNKQYQINLSSIG